VFGEIATRIIVHAVKDTFPKLYLRKDGVVLQIIPAIDLREGACSRILGDTAAARHIYSEDPLQQTLLLKEAGARMVHITDLDGAFSGHLCNLRVIQELVDYADLDIQLSGGIRSLSHVDTLLSLGVKRVVLSAAMLRRPQTVAAALEQYGDRVLAGIDGRDGMVTTEGFETVVRTTVQLQLEKMHSLGMRQIVYTDLRRAGALKGPNFSGIEDIIKSGGMDVIVAGGVSTLEAIERLKQMGASGVIIGKAIYTGAVDLSTAIAVSQ